MGKHRQSPHRHMSHSHVIEVIFLDYFVPVCTRRGSWTRMSGMVLCFRGSHAFNTFKKRNLVSFGYKIRCHSYLMDTELGKWDVIWDK